MPHYGDYVYDKFDNPDAVRKWSDSGLYSVSSNEGVWNYNDKFYRLKYVLEGVPQAGSEKAKALDLGCAGGVFMPFLVDKGYKTTGVDISSRMIEQARLYCEKYKIPAALHVMDVNRTDFPDKYFDVCIAVGLIEHQQLDGPLLKEVRRIMKPGGIFIVTVRNYICPHIRWESACSRLEMSVRRMFNSCERGNPSGTKKSHGREHILPEFLKVLKDNGFIYRRYRFSHFYILPYPFSRYFKRVDRLLSKPLEQFNSSRLLGFFGSTITIYTEVS